MKIFTQAILILCLTIPAFSAEKSDDELLAETTALSREVKEFGRTIGIEPTEALLKSVKEQTPVSLVVFYFQKRGSLEFTSFERAYLAFKLESSKMPIADYWLWNKQFSVFVRHIDEFSGNESVINPSFAKESFSRKVGVILHEDLHENILYGSDAQLAETREIIVTPLGFLAALKYFENKNDLPNINEMVFQINHFRTISQELNALAENIGALAQNTPATLVCSEIYEKNILDKYPKLKNRLLRMMKPTPPCVSEEAVITHELRYWKYFDRVAVLYEKSGDIKTLIEDMKKAPGKQDELEKYLEELDKKYSAAE